MSLSDSTAGNPGPARARCGEVQGASWLLSPPLGGTDLLWFGGEPEAGPRWGQQPRPAPGDTGGLRSYWQEIRLSQAQFRTPFCSERTQTSHRCDLKMSPHMGPLNLPL